MTNSVLKSLAFIAIPFFLTSCLNQDDDLEDQQKQFKKEQAAIDNYLADNNLDYEIDSYYGLRYILSGTGNDTLVQNDDYVDVSYAGYILGNTTPFKTKDTVLNLAQQIDGWKILLPKSEGKQNITMFIPSVYGYGAYGSVANNVPANSTLMYEVTVNKAYDGFIYQLQLIDEYLEANELIYAIDSTQSLRYVILEQGTGVKPSKNSSIRVDYVGRVLGSSSTFDSGENRTFNLGGLISGWGILMPYLKEGGKIRMFIPARFGYGTYPLSSIPSNSILDFEVELIEVI